MGQFLVSSYLAMNVLEDLERVRATNTSTRTSQSHP